MGIERIVKPVYRGTIGNVTEEVAAQVAGLAKFTGRSKADVATRLLTEALASVDYDEFRSAQSNSGRKSIGKGA